MKLEESALKHHVEQKELDQTKNPYISIGLSQFDGSHQVSDMWPIPGLLYCRFLPISIQTGNNTQKTADFNRDIIFKGEVVLSALERNWKNILREGEGRKGGTNERSLKKMISYFLQWEMGTLQYVCWRESEMG